MDLTIHVGESVGDVSALLLRPDDAWAGCVLAHGAGAGMRHSFMERIALALAVRGMATLRYQFPYLEQGGRRPNSPGVLEATVRTAVAKARELMPELPLFAGGKSMGGRMTSGAMAHRPLDEVRGIVFLGFPLHPAKQPGNARADHLRRVSVPMLFLQGTRDPLADLDLMTKVCAGLGPRATLHVAQGADHSFSVLKRSGRSDDAVLDELADAITDWARRV